MVWWYLATAFATALPAATLDGEALFAAARNSWAATAYPDVVDYDVVVRVWRGDARRTDRYRGQVRSSDGAFRVHPFSEAERRDPYTPHGINVTWSIGADISAGNRPVASGGSSTSRGLGVGGYLVKERPVEPFAIPEVSPLYSFGLRPCVPRRVRSASAAGPAIIGGVASANRRYRVTIAGPEPFDGVATTRLALTPLLDARRERLRELWLDASTDRPIAARLAGNFTGRAETSVPWLVRFATIDGATYVVDEIAEAPLERGGVTFDRVEIRFDDVVAHRGIRDFAFALPSESAGLNAIEEPADGRFC